jgi:hypothetical protein
MMVSRALAESGEPGGVELILDPLFKRPHPELVYQTMLEFLAYLRTNDFKT